MSDTPITDKHQSDCLRSGGRSIVLDRNAYWLARKFEARIAHALRCIEAKRQGNAEAATKDVSKEDAAWSAGVAHGLEIAAGFLRHNANVEAPPSEGGPTNQKGEAR